MNHFGSFQCILVNLVHHNIILFGKKFIVSFICELLTLTLITSGMYDVLFLSYYDRDRHMLIFLAKIKRLSLISNIEVGVIFVEDWNFYLLKGCHFRLC